MERELVPLKTFILPGGSSSAANLHVARTVCRRAERLVVALQDESPATISTIAYLNRLSDYLFVAAPLRQSACGRRRCALDAVRRISNRGKKNGRGKRT